VLPRPVNDVSTFQKVNKELPSRFNFPRSRPTAAAAAFPANSRTSREIASCLNPAANYGGRITQRRLHRQRTLPYVRASRQLFTSTNTCMTSQLFNKDIFLLLSPSLRKVSRGSQKTELQRLRCYVDALCFSIEMSEDQVKQKLTQVFEKLLVDSEGRPVR